MKQLKLYLLKKVQTLNLDNYFQLNATLAKIDILRYTPAGIPVLDVVLQHESWQEENGSRCLVKFELSGKIIGHLAKNWQYKQGTIVHVEGFLAQQSQKSFRPILRIQTIQEYRQN